MKWTSKDIFKRSPNTQRTRGFFTVGDKEGHIATMFAEIYNFVGKRGVKPTIKDNLLKFTVDDLIEGEPSGHQVSVQFTVKKCEQTEDEIEENVQPYFVQIEKTAGNSGAFMKLLSEMKDRDNCNLFDYEDATANDTI